MVTMVAAKMYNDAAKSWNELASKATLKDVPDRDQKIYATLMRDLSGDLIAFLKGILHTEEDFKSVGLKNGELPVKKDQKTDAVVEFVLFDTNRLAPIV